MQFIENLGRLREDVRIAKICVAVVGCDLRETPFQFRCGISQCSAAPAASSARGAREQLKQ
jgi:hypothetical protein